MKTSDSIQHAWQAAVADPSLPDLEEVRRRAEGVYGQVRRRNRVEYGATLLVILLFYAAAVSFTDTLSRVGAVLVICGAVLGAWQLHRRASALEPPGDSARSLIAHERAQLVRQRDALASIATWYLLPLFPGLTVLVAGRLLEEGATRISLVRWEQLAASGVIVLVFAFTWWMNRAAARTLQTEIDALDAVEGETE